MSEIAVLTYLGTHFSAFLIQTFLRRQKIADVNRK